MIEVHCDCGATYELKDELRGKKLKCPDCGAVSIAGEPAGGRDYGDDLDPVFMRDKFLLRQKHLALTAEKYYVWDETGQTILFVERPAHLLQNLGAVLAGLVAAGVVGVACAALGSILPREAQPAVGLLAAFAGLAALLVVAVMLSAKRHVTFYRDESRGAPLLRVLQDKKAQLIVATYTVLDAEGAPLARLRKNYLYNIFRKRWHVIEPDSERVVAMALEDSLILSMLRRLLGPMLGLLRTNFIITRGETERVIGEFNRKFTLLDRYVLDMSADAAGHLDRRVAVALGLMLDTGEKR